MRNRNRWKWVAAFGALVLFASCVRVPLEAVRLSSILGDDIVATQTSYQLLITKHFDNLRLQANDFIDNRWKPVFLGKFITSGDLVGRAKDPDPNAVLRGVTNWAQVAVDQIEAKRKELIAPINDDEKALSSAVNEAFNRMVQENSSITAHLNSVRKVNAFQDQILQAAGVKDLRDRINKTLIDTSNKAQQAIDAVAKADGVVTQVENQLR